MNAISCTRASYTKKRSILGIGLDDLDEEDIKDIRTLDEYGICKEDVVSIAYEFYQQNGLNRDNEITDALWRFCPKEEPQCLENDMWLFCTWGNIQPTQSKYEQFISNFDNISKCFLNLVQSLGLMYGESFYRIGDDDSFIDVTHMDNHHTCLIINKVDIR